MSVTGVKIEAKMEMDTSNASTPNTSGLSVGGGGGNNINRGGGDRGARRRRGGGGPGPGRNSFGGGRGGGGGGGHGGGGGGGGGFQSERVERRPFGQDGGGYEGPHKKPKMGMGNPEHRIIDKIMALSGPTADLPPKKYELKKFMANTRLYIGNISNEVTEAEIKDLFSAFGELDELFLNREKNFAFLKLDYRTNAEKARAELDQTQIKGRPIKVRFAPAGVRVKVKNLSPMVSNELLELAFSVFGEVERALVYVDEKGKSLGEGVVDFSRKNYAQAAHKFCSDKCYFITSDLRPVVTDMGDMNEVDEGLLEINMPKREYGKDRELVYYKAREMGLRLANEGSFEQEYGTKWKALVLEHKQKELALKEEMVREVEKLQAQMEIARYDYETEMLRQQLRQRELDQERQKMQWEQRLDRIGGGFGGMGQNRMGDGGGLDNGNLVPRENPGPEGGLDTGLGADSSPLAPPPMPPQGLMQHLQGRDEAANNSEGPTWEIGPFGFNQMSGNYGRPNMNMNDQRGDFGGSGHGGMGRGGMGGGGRGGGGGRPGGRGGFRGGRGGRR